MTNHAGARAERWLAHRAAVPAILFVTLLVTLPSLAGGFYGDDYALRAALHGRMPFSPPWYDLYHFAPGTPDVNRAVIQAGGLPWFASPGFDLHLVRPLASALFALDERLFGASPIGYHVHSIVWYLALVAAVGLLLRRVLPRATANFALLLFAINEAHVFPFGWIACRHMLVAATPAVLGLYAYVRSYDEESRRARWRVLGILGMTLGLAAGEAAFAAVAYALAHAMLAPAPKASGARARVLGALPIACVALTYVALWGLAGGGARHSGGYIDPISSPGAFVVAAATRLPILLGDAVLAIPADLANGLPNAPLVALGVVSTALVGWLYAACRRALPEAERGALRWLVPGALLALAANLGGFPGARLLLLPNVGFAALLAVLLRHAFRRIEGGGWLGLAARRAFAGLLVAIHVVMAPLVAVASTRMNTGLARKVEAVAHTAEIDGSPHKRVYVIAASDPMVSMYPPAVLLAEGSEAASCWTVFSATKATHRLTRTTASSFTLEPVGTTMLNGPFETLFRPRTEPLQEGVEASVCGATVRVLAMRGGSPSRIEVRLDVALEDPSARLLVWRDDKLRALGLPKVGETIDLPWSAGPTGLF